MRIDKRHITIEERVSDYMDDEDETINVLNKRNPIEIDRVSFCQILISFASL